MKRSQKPRKASNSTVFGMVKVMPSPRKNKQLVAKFPDGKKVHFGDPDMPEFPGTKRGDAYCARSYGLGKKNKTLNDPRSANTLSRKILWNCRGKKSLRK